KNGLDTLRAKRRGRPVIRVTLWLLAALFVVAASCSVAFNVIAAIGHSRARRRVECPDDADEPLSLLLRVGIVATECALTLALLLPLGRAPRASSHRGQGRRRPVVLVHGYGQGPGSWRRFADWLARDGWAEIHAVRRPDPLGDVERSATALADAIDR